MVFGLFSKEKALKRTIEKATSSKARSDERWPAMEKLLQDGSDDAVYALVKRFSFVCDKMIEDQKEKDWLVHSLVNKGAAVIDPVHRFMKSAKSLGYPLKVLAEVADHSRALQVIDDILADEEPGYTNDPKRRIDIIEWLAELEGPSNEDIVRRVAPYLADFDENVRFKTIEAISLRPHDLGAEPLVNALINEEEESQRLKIRIAEVLADNNFDLAGKKSDISVMFDAVLKGFKLHRDRLQRK